MGFRNGQDKEFLIVLILAGFSMASARHIALTTGMSRWLALGLTTALVFGIPMFCNFVLRRFRPELADSIAWSVFFIALVGSILSVIHDFVVWIL